MTVNISASRTYNDAKGTKFKTKFDLCLTTLGSPTVVQRETSWFKQNENTTQYSNKYYLQHERPCYIGYTNSSQRREVVCPIQHGRRREYRKVLVIRMDQS